MARLSIWGRRLWAFAGRHRKVLAILLLPLGIVMGAGFMQWRSSHQSTGTTASAPGRLPRGKSAPKSGADKTVDAAVILAGQAEKAIEEVIANYTARTRGEALVFLAGAGNLEAVKYLLQQGEDLNTRDRHGRTPLIGAAGGGKLEVVDYFLAQAKVDRQAVDLAGNNAFVHALAAKSPAAARRLKEAGVGWPELHQGESNPKPETDPQVITEDDVTSFDGVLTMLAQQTSYDGKSGQLGTVAQNEEPTLWAAIQNIDCDEQLNEPEIQQESLAERRRATTLLLNRLVGTTSRASLLYECERWRHIKLPDAVMKEVRALREHLKQHPEKVTDEGQTITSPEAMVRMRKINGLILDFAMGSVVRIHFGEGKTASAPRPLPPELLPSNAPAYTKSALSESDVQYKPLEEVQDMIWEIYAAAGMRFKKRELNERFKAKGYKQISSDPPLTPVQQRNIDLLSKRRTELKAQAEAAKAQTESQY